jgi:uncharacterized repeat protein (TIGR02543 family)
MARLGRAAAFFSTAVLVLALAACSNLTSEDTKQYTITFNSQGGTEVASITRNEGTGVDEPVPPTRADYVFLGWFSSAADSGTKYTWPHTLNASVTMYAHWRSADDPTPGRYTITFDSHEGAGVTAITEDEGTAVAKPADPTRSGFVFEGWFSAVTGGTLYVWPHTLNADVTMHAQWRSADDPTPDRYTITFDSHEGAAVTAITADKGTAVPKPADPPRSGFVFEGWYSAATGGTKYDWPHTLSANVTMHAQWQAADDPTPEQYAITFDSHEGAAVTAITADKGTAVPKPADPTRDGFVFQGWYDAAAGGTKYEWPHTLNASVTMHAQWQAETPAPPAALTGTVTVTGTPWTGGTLSAVTTALGGSGAMSYVWERGDTAAGNFTGISGADGAAYMLAAGDLGKYIRVTVSRADNSGTVSSAAAGPVTLPALSGTVTVSGTPWIGETLTAVTTALGGSGAVSYVWERSAQSTGGGFAAISGETGAAYMLTTWDLDKYVRVTVSRGDNSGTISSAPTEAVENPPDGARTITIGFNYGALEVEGDDGENLIYKWSEGPKSLTLTTTPEYSDVYWYVDGNPVPGGTGNTVTIKAEDYGSKPHSVAFIGTRAGKLYSQTLTFTVKN